MNDMMESIYTYNTDTGKITRDGKPYRCYDMADLADEICRHGKKSVRPDGQVTYSLVFVFDEHENTMLPKHWL